MQLPIIKQLHQIAEERDGRCLSDSCRDDNTTIRLECSKKHRWEAIAGHIRLHGKWCPVCAGSGRTARKAIKDMHDLADERVGRCLSKTYNGSLSKLLWECAKGHQWEAIPSSIKSGSWCPVCAGNARHTIEDMQDVAAEHDGLCLSVIYKNNITKLLWECSEGHQWEAMPMKVLKGTWCRKCHNAKRSNQSKMEQAA